MFAGRNGSANALIALAARRADFAQSLAVVTDLHHAAALAGVEEMVGDQSLPEACLKTSANEPLEPSYIAELDISAVLQFVAVCSSGTTDSEACSDVAAERVTVLGLQVHRVSALIALDVPDIGSQTQFVPAVRRQIAPVERFALRLAGRDKRQEVADLIILE